MTDELLVAAAVLPFAGALGAALLPRRARDAAAGLAGLSALVGLGCVLALIPAVASGRSAAVSFSWLPSLGLAVTLRIDGLAWLFSLLVLGIGALVALYARYYMAPGDSASRFFSLLLAFMGAMQGVVLAGDLIQLVVFWELTSLLSFLLVGYWSGKPQAREGARMALTVTAAGGLCLLAGMILIGRIVGSTDLATVLASGDRIRESPLYLPALVLVLAGALTKSAQVPFHFWLPRAMAAPTPVSAYLHSATLVKAGIFLMIRLYPVLAETDAWYILVGTAGVATMLFGAWCAVFQHDLKGLLAYSTISHLGLITLLLGLDSTLSVVAAIFHTVNHATFKASLFMAAGIIDHETGTRDLRRLSGLRRAMPVTATLAMVAAAAMAGVPLLNGFLSKEMFLAEAVAGTHDRALNAGLPLVAAVASALSVLYSLRFIRQTFFGPPALDLPRAPHEPPRWMRFPVEALVVACVAVGLAPGLIIGTALEIAVVAVFGERAPAYSLSLWHGFNLPLALSLAALVVGVGLYRLLGPRIDTNPRGGPWLLDRLDAARLFDRAMVGLERGARWLEDRLGAARLQDQLRILLLVALVLALTALLHGAGIAPANLRLSEAGLDPAFALLWLVGGASAVAAAAAAKYQRLAAIIFAGGAGLVSCITFAWLSAPDLAATQILIEVVTTVLLLLGLRWLPKRDRSIPIPASEKPRARRRRAADLALAVAFGACLAGLSYAVMARPAGEGIARFFVENVYSGGGGRNVVNVLLVDFRAFDTLGEITVLGIVGLTVLALLRRFRPAADSLDRPAPQRRLAAWERTQPDRTPGDSMADAMRVPATVMTWLFPVLVVLALHLFLRGHDLPGGGFAAGIALSIAFVLQYMAHGARWVDERLAIRPVTWIGCGLLVAAGVGAGSWLFGRPYLTTAFAYAEIPGLGKVPLASALLFDLGVVVLVVGATVLMLVALARQSLRRARAEAAGLPQREEA